MVEGKQMPNEKKYAIILNFMNVIDSYVLPLVRENLGEQKVQELQQMWRQEQKSIPEHPSSEDMYEIAFSNWLRKWQTAYDFVRKNLGDQGIEKFTRSAIDALKNTFPKPAIYFLGFIRVIAPGSAFKMVAKQIMYQTQVFTPFSLTELTSNRLVLDIPHCKVLEHPCGEDFCKIGCQVISTVPLKDLLKVDMSMNRQGNNCTATCKPL